jgi:rare lipoprotein A
MRRETTEWSTARRCCAALVLLVLPVLLTACGGSPSRSSEATAERSKLARKSGVVQKRGGGYYKDDGPGDEIPDNLDDIPDAQPRLEPLHRFANRPYVVLGKAYQPRTSLAAYQERGIASWYGKKFHGQKTSIGEPYDMFSMTAAHPTLAIPSYVRVTNVSNGRSVVVRVIDRGPFHADRVIDLSYAAAYRLDYVDSGSTMVQVDSILPDGATTMTYAQVMPAVAAPAPGAGAGTGTASAPGAAPWRARPDCTTGGQPRLRGGAGGLVVAGGRSRAPVAAAIGVRTGRDARHDDGAAGCLPAARCFRQR